MLFQRQCAVQSNGVHRTAKDCCASAHCELKNTLVVMQCHLQGDAVPLAGKMMDITIIIQIRSSLHKHHQILQAWAIMQTIPRATAFSTQTYISMHGHYRYGHLMTMCNNKKALHCSNVRDGMW